jgi:hypothetical protein
MKSLKIFSILTVAALLLSPVAAMAKTNFSISLNLFDCLRPVFIPQPPPPVIIAPPPQQPIYYFVPCHPYPQRQRVFVFHPQPHYGYVEEVPSQYPRYTFPEQ